MVWRSYPEDGLDENFGSGVDVEAIVDVPWTNTNLWTATSRSQSKRVVRRHLIPASSYAGRWTAKKPVFKSLEIPSSDAGTAMHDISVEADVRGIPRVDVRDTR